MTDVTELRVCIDVDDLDAAIRFYTQALGLTPGRRFSADWAELLRAGSTIDLLVKPAGSPPSKDSRHVRDYGRHWTPVHLDFVVADIEAGVQRARAAGATLEGEVQVKRWGRLATMADPFGHGFCLLEFRGRGYDELVGG